MHAGLGDALSCPDSGELSPGRAALLLAGLVLDKTQFPASGLLKLLHVSLCVHFFPSWFPCRGGHEHQALCHGVLCQLCFDRTRVGLPVLDTQGLGGQIQNTEMSDFNWETF